MLLVAPGAYTLSVSAEGFKTASEAVTIRAGQTSIENISLEAAEIPAAVTVTSGVEGIKKTEAAPVTTVTRSMLQTLRSSISVFWMRCRSSLASCAGRTGRSTSRVRAQARAA